MVDDLISRQSAINAIENTECELLPEEWNELTDAIMNVPSAQPSSYDMINEAHNEGFDVGYWAGRRDYEQKWIPVSERLQSAKPEALTDVDVLIKRQAVIYLDLFTKTYCRDDSVKDDLFFRCNQCDFGMPDGRCLVKIMARKLCPDYREFGSMGNL